MSADDYSHGNLQFLTVAEAADRLGLSRIRVREAAARGAFPSRHDNEGRLRIDLSDASAVEFKSAGDVAPGVLLDMLFDEIEELQSDLDGARGETARVLDLAERQAQAIAQADAALDQAGEDKARLAALLDRAMAHLEAGEGKGDARLAQIADRALGSLEETGGRLEESLGVTAKFDALLARATDLADQARAASGQDAQAMAQSADRALELLDKAMGEAESGQRAAAKTGEMLDRALAAGERLESEVAARDQTIADRTATADRALEVSERALALAGSGGTQAPRKGFWRRLFGG